MEENKFKIGDVVTLKSGGIKMTIEKINPDGSYACVYHFRKKEERKIYQGELLKKVVDVKIDAEELKKISSITPKKWGNA